MHASARGLILCESGTLGMPASAAKTLRGVEAINPTANSASRRDSDMVVAERVATFLGATAGSMEKALVLISNNDPRVERRAARNAIMLTRNFPIDLTIKRSLGPTLEST